jgi:hypothetical protein
MAYLTVNDVYNLLSGEILTSFPDVPFEFQVKNFHNRSELWVYVLNSSRLKEVEEFCRSLERRPMEPPLPIRIRILVKTWSGPWPGGESEQTIRKRRQAYIDQSRKQTSSTT